MAGLAVTLAGCLGDPPGFDDAERDLGAESARRRAVPLSSHSAEQFVSILSNRILVARFTDDYRDILVQDEAGQFVRQTVRAAINGFTEVIHYGADGDGSLLARDAVTGVQYKRSFRWELRTRRLPGGGGYAFISGDGREDGASLQFLEPTRVLAFSDVDRGAYFSFGVIQECWPGFAAALPPAGTRRCSNSEDARTRARLTVARETVLKLRTEANAGLMLDPSRIASLAGSRAEFAPRPGSVFKTSLGDVHTVTGVAGLRVEFRDQTSKPTVSYGLLYEWKPGVQGNEAAIAALGELWPLTLGKTAEAWVYDASGAWRLTWRVIAREVVRVPAGSFEAWRIEHTEQALSGEIRGGGECWYAPAIGWMVKDRHWRGRAETAWELVAATPPPARNRGIMAAADGSAPGDSHAVDPQGRRVDAVAELEIVGRAELAEHVE